MGAGHEAAAQLALSSDARFAQLAAAIERRLALLPTRAALLRARAWLAKLRQEPLAGAGGGGGACAVWRRTRNLYAKLLLAQLRALAGGSGGGGGGGAVALEAPFHAPPPAGAGLPTLPLCLTVRFLARPPRPATCPGLVRGRAASSRAGERLWGSPAPAPPLPPSPVPWRPWPAQQMMTTAAEPGGDWRATADRQTARAPAAAAVVRHRPQVSASGLRPRPCSAPHLNSSSGGSGCACRRCSCRCACSCAHVCCGLPGGATQQSALAAEAAALEADIDAARRAAAALRARVRSAELTGDAQESCAAAAAAAATAAHCAPGDLGAPAPEERGAGGLAHRNFDPRLWQLTVASARPGPGLLLEAEHSNRAATSATAALRAGLDATARRLAALRRDLDRQAGAALAAAGHAGGSVARSDLMSAAAGPAAAGPDWLFERATALLAGTAAPELPELVASGGHARAAAATSDPVLAASAVLRVARGSRCSSPLGPSAGTAGSTGVLIRAAR